MAAEGEPSGGLEGDAQQPQEEEEAAARVVGEAQPAQESPHLPPPPSSSPSVVSRAAKKEEEEAGEEFECRICFHFFDLEGRAPKLLGCLHTFCRACLTELHRRGQGDEGEAFWLACPLCRHRTPLPAGRVQSLPVNTKLVEALLLQLRGWAPSLLRELGAPQPRCPPALECPSSATVAGLERSGACLSEGARSPSRGESCSRARWSRQQAGCACFVFVLLALALLGFAWMEWLTGSIFLGIALLLLFASTLPFLYSFSTTFRSQPRTIFFTRAPAAGGGGGGGSSTREAASCRSPPGRSRW